MAALPRPTSPGTNLMKSTRPAIPASPGHNANTMLCAGFCFAFCPSKKCVAESCGRDGAKQNLRLTTVYAKVLKYFLYC